MKLKLSTLLFLILLASPSLTLAAAAKPHTIEIGTESSYINYEEPGYMEQSGSMFGIVGSYTYSGNIMLRADGKFSYGYVDYDSNGTGSMDDVPDYMFEIRGVFGYDIPFSTTLVATPYMGFGYRYLNDDSAGMVTTTGHYGYERESNYFYAPIGIEATAEFARGWKGGLTVEYDYFLGGVQESHLSDVSPAYGDVTTDQDSGYGFRGSIRVEKQFGGFEFLVEPFVKYWKIDDSEIAPIVYGGAIVGYGLEPENNSTEIGVKIGLIF